ncbi:MAG TPA: hypothetical protein VGN07_09280 [Steroidobacteraceae bacterium]|jgi:hypothetical protein
MRGISAFLGWIACIVVMETSSAAPAVLQVSKESANIYSNELRNAQFQRLSSMRGVDVGYDEYGRMRTIQGPTGIFVADAAKIKAGDRMLSLLSELKEVLMATGSESLTVRRVVPAINGGRVIDMDISIDGMPMVDGGVNIRVSKDDEIDLLGSRFVPGVAVTKDIRTADVAKEDLLKDLEETGQADRTTVSFLVTPALILWTNNGLEKAPILVWSFETTYNTPQGELEGVRFYVDASTGEVRGAYQTIFRD